MHPELLNNTHFLRYYRQWQDDPNSIVFAPIAEYLLSYGLIDQAFRVCREGLKRHSSLISGRLVMAKIHFKRGNFEEARDELQKILQIVPDNQNANDMMKMVEKELNVVIPIVDLRREKMVEREEVVQENSKVDQYLPLDELSIRGQMFAAVERADDHPFPSRERGEDEPSEESTSFYPSWQTITMAQIYAAQGYVNRAKGIYKAILSRDPANEAARKGLKEIA